MNKIELIKVIEDELIKNNIDLNKKEEDTYTRFSVDDFPLKISLNGITILELFTEIVVNNKYLSLVNRELILSSFLINEIKSIKFS